MKKRKNIILGITLIFTVCAALTGGFYYFKNDGNKKAKTANMESPGYTVKQKISEDNLKAADLKSNKEFDIESAAVKNKKLAVTANADIDDPGDAYKTAVVIRSSVSDLNKDKIKKSGINSVEIILKGKSRCWMYDGGSSISEIALEDKQNEK